MKQLCIRSITRKKWRPVTIKKEITQERPNLLKQDFSTNEINQKWCADITYIETQADGWCYLSTVMDLHSKMIIGYSFSQTMDTDLVLRTLDQAISNQTINGQLILHTDQGTQYTSKSYQSRLTELGIRHSFSRKGCPYDNAGIESFHATLKKELVYQCPVYSTFEAAKTSLFDYVLRFYNRQRIHSGIDYLTPFEMEMKSKQIPA
jgi:transposase InsO family protein